MYIKEGLRMSLTHKKNWTN